MPLSATLRIPRYGYTPGEVIPISAEVENLSNKRMKSTKIRLYQDVVFRATNKTKNTTRILQEHCRGPIGQNSFDSWVETPLSIPPIAPTGLGGCTIIDVSYRLEFIVDPQRFGFALKISSPMMIGNIPLKSCFHQILPPEMNDDDSTSANSSKNQQLTNDWEDFSDSQTHQLDCRNPATTTTLLCPSAPPLPPTDYDNLPRPSYADAVAAYEDGRPNQLKSDHDLENTEANWDFNPRYPVWSMSSACSQ